MKQNGNNKDGEPLDRLKPLVLECLHFISGLNKLLKL